MKQQNPRSQRSLFTQAHTAADLQSVFVFHQGFALMVGVSVRIVFKVEFRFGLELRLSLGLG